MERLRETFEALTLALRAGAMTSQEVSEAIGSMGYQVISTVLEGPRMTVQFALRDEEVSRGDPIALSPDGTARRAREWEVPIGIAIEDGRMQIGADFGGEVRVQVAGRFAQENVEARIRRLYERATPDAILVNDVPHQAIHASVAFIPSWARQGSVAFTGELRFPGLPARRVQQQHRFRYTERFPEEVQNKAWELLKQFMTVDQHFAFMEGSNIELQNRDETYRLLINRSGNFSILQGDRGAGIVATAGKIYSKKYPLGDEIAAFLDWFNHRTEELIAQWNCGTYGIKREDELHRR